MRFIVCYDVSDDMKRSKLARKLKAFGIRTQYSLFEIETDNRTILKLLAEVETILDEIDKFFVYPVENAKNIIRMGVAETGELTYMI